MGNVIKRYCSDMYIDLGFLIEHIEYSDDKNKNIYCKFSTSVDQNNINNDPSFFDNKKEYIENIMNDFNEIIDYSIDKAIYLEEVRTDEKQTFIEFIISNGDNFVSYEIYLNIVDLPKELEHISNTLKALIRLDKLDNNKSVVYPISHNIYLKKDGKSITVVKE